MAQYLVEPRRRHFSLRPLAVLAAFLIVAFMVGVTLFVPGVAFAEQDSEKIMEKSLEEYTKDIKKPEPTPSASAPTPTHSPTSSLDVGVPAPNPGEEAPTAFQLLMEKAQKDTNPDRNSFGYVIHRLLYTGYMNDVREAIPPKGAEKLKFICDADHKWAGTALYHNCDVPNVLTEFVQLVADILNPQGIQKTVRESAVVGLGFGLPSGIPNDEVPVKESERAVKYTGLELLGYNLRYSMYAGEWDHIKVMTEARAMANYGMIDSVRLGVGSVMKGVVAGVSAGAAELGGGWQKLKSGDVMGALATPFTAIKKTWEKGTTATANTILDSSDLNVHNTLGWYRLGYPDTLYNARQMTAMEQAAYMRAQLEKEAEEDKPETAESPEEFNKLKSGPPKPQEAVGICSFSDNTRPAVIGGTEEECLARSTVADKSDVKWNPEGNQKQEKLAAWKEKNKSFFEQMKKYQMSCDLDATSEANREAKISTFYNCITKEWEKNRERVVNSAQKEVNDKWSLDLFAPLKWLGNYLEKRQENFNSPFKRFVCVDKNGETMKDGKKFVYYFTEKGERNSKCEPMRPPVQGAYFGDGYLPGVATGNQNPGVDTRYAMFDQVNFAALFFDVRGNTNDTANSWLGVTTFIARISNTAIDLSFSPILEKLGLSDRIVNIIEAFRESIFAPLAGTVIALGALQIFWSLVRRRAYREAMVSIAVMVGIFIMGTIALASPKTLLKIVDEVPSEFERIIVGAIYNIGPAAEDQLCVAPVTSTSGFFAGIQGASQTRTLGCDVWRIFAFEPYVSGQWGVPYGALYANGSGKERTVSNTNGNLVGTAAVPMGGGITENNWALYQAYIMTSGTSTTDDPSNPTGVVPRDLYRVVDMQAGPNNGAGRDGRYLESWSGRNMVARLGTSILSVPVAIVGLITIVSFALIKIEITLISAFMLLLLPILLLIGLHPTIGRVRLRSYLGTLLSMMFQRVMLVAALAIMLKILTSIALASDGYFIMAIAIMAVCIFFLLNWRNWLNAFASAVNAEFGGTMFAGNTQKIRQQAVGWVTPLSLQNYTARSKNRAVSTAQAGLGGFMVGARSGGLRGAAEGAKVSVFGGEMRDGSRREGAWELADRRTERSQMRTGMGRLRANRFASDAAVRDAKQRARASETFAEAGPTLQRLDKAATEAKRSEMYEEGQRRGMSKEEVDELVPFADPDTLRIDLNNEDDLRSVNKIEEIEVQRQKVVASSNRETEKERKKLAKINNLGFDREAREYQAEIDRRKERVRSELNNLAEKKRDEYFNLYSRHQADPYKVRSASEMMANQIADLEDQLNDEFDEDNRRWNERVLDESGSTGNTDDYSGGNGGSGSRGPRGGSTRAPVNQNTNQNAGGRRYSTEELDYTEHRRRNRPDSQDGTPQPESDEHPSPRPDRRPRTESGGRPDPRAGSGDRNGNSDNNGDIPDVGNGQGDRRKDPRGEQ